MKLDWSEGICKPTSYHGRSIRDKVKMYSLHVIGRRGVDILRHGADVPLLHDLGSPSQRSGYD